MVSIELERVHGDYGFEAKDAYGNILKMDSSPETGGQNYGSRPMQLLLVALGGCSAIDVISILKKQRQEIRDYKMLISGNREEGKEPSLWKNVEIAFHIYGNVNEEKAKKAVELSLSKYCSVAATLKGSGTEIKTEVFVHP